MFLAWVGLPARCQGTLRVALIFTLVVFWLPPVYFALVAFHGMYLMCPVLALFTISAVVSARYAGEGLGPENQATT
jgi:uncharacterized membrane protein